MPYDYMGYQVPDEIWKQGRVAGIAGAVGGMATVSGDRWNGVADWLSRAAAGYARSSNDYVQSAIDHARQQQQDDIQEEVRRQAIEESDARIAAAKAKSDQEASARSAVHTLLRDHYHVDPTGDDQFDFETFKALRKQEQDRAELGAINAENAKSGYPALTGNSQADQLRVEQWKRDNPAPEHMTPYQQWEIGQAEAKDSEAARHVGAAYADLTPEEQKLVSAPWKGGTLEEYKTLMAKRGTGGGGSVDLRAIAEKKRAETIGGNPTKYKNIDEFYPPTAKPVAPPPKPSVAQQKEDKRPELEKAGLVTPNVSAATPTTGGTATPRLDPNPNVPTPDETGKAVASLGVAPNKLKIVLMQYGDVIRTELSKATTPAERQMVLDRLKLRLATGGYLVP